MEPIRIKHQPGAKRAGWIEVISGCMFSGKTEELIRRLSRARIAKQNVEIFKPKIDVRYHETEVVSHNSLSIPSNPVGFAEQILLMAGNCDVVGIDEAQFFDDALPNVCIELANQGKRVICAGLDMDYLGRPFGCMPQLITIAEYVTKVQAVCMQCGSPASYSYRLSEADKQVMLGAHAEYEARCRTCFNHGQELKKQQK